MSSLLIYGGTVPARLAERKRSPGTPGNRQSAVLDRGDIHPSAARLGGSYRCVDGRDASQSVFGGGIGTRESRRFASLLACAQLFCNIGVDVAERAEESFGMSHRHARREVRLG